MKQKFHPYEGWDNQNLVFKSKLSLCHKFHFQEVLSFKTVLPSFSSYLKARNLSSSPKVAKNQKLMYESGIRQEAPEAIHVTDRFH